MPATRTKHKLMIAVALLNTLLFSGIVFGFPALQLMLKQEGQYSELCADPVAGCAQQTLKLNLMFTVASFLVNGISLPSGVFLDKFGPKVMICVAGVSMVAGLALFAYCDSKTMDAFVGAYALIAMGGQMTLFSAFPSAFLQMQWQTLVMTMISCIFDGSCVVFQLFSTFHQTWGWSRRDMFLSYAAVAALCYALETLLWCRSQSDLDSGDDDEDDYAKLQEKESAGAGAVVPKPPLAPSSGGSRGSNDGFASESGEIVDYSVEYGSIQTDPASAMQGQAQPQLQSQLVPLIERGLFQQLKSPEFAFIVFFATLGVFRANMYIGVNSILLVQYGDGLFHFGKQHFFNMLFGYLLPCGFIFIPCIERSTELLGVQCALTICNVLGIVVFLLGTIPSLPLQAVNFLLFAGYRAFLYAVMASYIAQTFGFATLGRITGCVFTLSSFINLLQPPLLALWMNELVNLLLLMAAFGIVVAAVLQYMAYRASEAPSSWHGIFCAGCGAICPTRFGGGLREKLLPGSEGTRKQRTRSNSLSSSPRWVPSPSTQRGRGGGGGGGNGGGNSGRGRARAGVVRRAMSGGSEVEVRTSL